MEGITKVLSRVVLYFIGMACLGMGLLWKYQDGLLYMPPMYQIMKDNPAGYQLPSDRPELKNFRHVVIRGKREGSPALKGWFIQGSEKLSDRTIVFFHENGGNIGMRMDWFQGMVKNLDVNILTIAYRGYSESEGFPSEQGLKEDGLDIMMYTKNNKDTLVAENGSFFLLGRSLGGAVATYVIAHPETPKGLFEGVILENSFTSISKEVDFMSFLPITYFKDYILTKKLDTIKLAPEIKLPVLFVTGDQDEIVPPEMTQKLHDAAINAPQRLMLNIPGGTHNDTWQKGGKRYFNQISFFMVRAEKKEDIARLMAEAKFKASQPETEEEKKAQQERRKPGAGKCPFGFDQ